MNFLWLLVSDQRQAYEKYLEILFFSGSIIEVVAKWQD